MDAREALWVELVDEEGVAVGSATVAAAHHGSGLLHRAFSVMFMARDGRVLLQRRAAAKTRFSLLWANTCCGHPAPGESVHVAARRRLREELGVAPRAYPDTFIDAGILRYNARDPVTGLIEREFDHVLCAMVDPALPLAPAMAEVAEARWVQADAVVAGQWPPVDQQVPWLRGVLVQALGASASQTASS